MTEHEKGSTGDRLLRERVADADPGAERVQKRARELAAEGGQEPVEDPEAQARIILEDSDARTEDPAARSLDDDRVERRTSEDATRPIES